MDPRADNKINFAAKEFGSKMEAGGYLRGGKKSIKERNRKVSPSFFFFEYLFIWLCQISCNTDWTTGCSTEWNLHCIMWDLLLRNMDSLIVAPGLQSAQASVVALRELNYSMACGILVPWPGIEPVSPALQSGFLTAGLLRKPLSLFFLEWPNLCLRESENKVCVPLSLSKLRWANIRGKVDLLGMESSLFKRYWFIWLCWVLVAACEI